jgi:hypothetical protein
MKTLLLTTALLVPLMANAAHAGEWFQLIRATQTTPNPDTCVQARAHDKKTAPPARLRFLTMRTGTTSRARSRTSTTMKLT